LYKTWWYHSETTVLAFLMMSRKVNTAACIFALWLTASIPLWSQSYIANAAVEEVGLLTDRTIYIFGEEIQFSAAILSALPNEESKVLYVELITPNGKKIEGNKFLVTGRGARGCLMIPEEVITGIYYLRAYTKYMRNAGPDAYAYVSIKIINPLSNDVLSGEENNLASGSGENENPTGEKVFNISTGKNEFQIGENINVSVVLNDLTHHFQGSLVSLAVIPESTGFDHAPNKNLQVANRTVTAIDFQPETRGISITGQLIDGSTGNPVSNGRVNLSIIGQGRDFEAMQTDTAGRYYFSLPGYTGQRDIFLCAETDTLLKPVLRVDNDFCPLPVHLPSPAFSLTAGEREVVQQLYRNARVTKYYHPDTLECISSYETTGNPFYGRPSDVLVLDKFVQLPTLEEYFNELPSSVKVRMQNGHKYFKVIGDRAEMNYFNPLVMVDWVAVNNPEKILAASPNNIDRIEVITVPYIKGNITYGGIVSIVSRRGDFAGIDLPASGIFFNYKFFEDTCHCKIKQENSADLPDSRNTVYWNPNVKWDANHRADISFPSPSIPGKYNIVVQGLNPNGEIYQQFESFTVKMGD